MTPERLALYKANEQNIHLANERLSAVSGVELDVLNAVDEGLLDPMAHQRETADIIHAFETLREEVRTREALQSALADRHPDSQARVDTLLAKLQALRTADRDTLYRGGAKVADPCIPCLEKAFFSPTPTKPPRKTPHDPPPLDKKAARKAVRRVKSRIASADPEVLAKINEQLGTRVNFAALSRFEGGQWTRGYVPPAGRSGVTIGTGFDVGQWRTSDLRNKLGMPESLAQQLDPYTGHIRGDAAARLRAMPLSVSRDDANLIDQASHRYFVRETAAYWDAHRGPNTPEYRDLSSAQQTVLFSRSYHQGIGMPRTAVARDFYSAAQRNDWAAAESALRNYHVRQGWYRERVGAEARLLRDERGG